MTKIVRLTLMTSAAMTLMSAAALAAPAVALAGDKTLVMFDTETLAVAGMMDVTGVESLHGIDVRPADGLLYGVAADNTVVTIELATGAATVKSSLSEALPEGVAAIVDFNPMADRLRLMGTDGTNLRANVDDGMVTVDGKLAYEEADMHAGEAPAIAAAAYTNSVGKPEATKMFDIDTTIVALIQQTKPNDGTLAAIGKLGIDGAENYAIDISATAELVNTAYLLAGTTLHTVDLETGAATAVGELSGLDGMAAIRDIAILP
ncbi:DUF4394 domain-containing protein [uncultured Devosia sp.]|uniref:DUF4394 domain-containing protein n=1 Tax=uncultured Devosia sp. TaxID=211434 RepID=UPI0035CBFB79